MNENEGKALQSALDQSEWGCVPPVGREFGSPDYDRLEELDTLACQFANSLDLDSELLNAIMDALTAHNTMSKQALDSVRVRSGLKSILLGTAGLYEALRQRGEADGRPYRLRLNGRVQ